MSKPSIDDLGTLFTSVVRSLTKRVSAPIVTTNGDGERVEVENTEGMAASSADLAVAVALLKNNGITADPATNKELSELQRRIEARKQKRGAQGLSAVVADAKAILDGIESQGPLQ